MIHNNNQKNLAILSNSEHSKMHAAIGGGAK